MGIRDWGLGIRDSGNGESASSSVKKYLFTASPIPFFTCLSLVSLVLAFGAHTPIYPFLFDHVPGFGQFQAPARLLCLWTWGVSVLAGIGAEMWQPSARIKRVARYGITVGLGLLLAALGANRVLIGKTLTFVSGLAQLGISLVLAGGLALAQPRSSEKRRRFVWSAVVIALVAVDLVAAQWGANPTAEPWLYTRPTTSGLAVKGGGYKRAHVLSRRRPVCGDLYLQIG